MSDRRIVTPRPAFLLDPDRNGYTVNDRAQRAVIRLTYRVLRLHTGRREARRILWELVLTTPNLVPVARNRAERRGQVIRMVRP